MRCFKYDKDPLKRIIPWKMRSTAVRGCLLAHKVQRGIDCVQMVQEPNLRVFRKTHAPYTFT